MTSSTNVPQQTGPLNIEQALHQAISHHQAGRWPEAERFYLAILQAQPGNPDANHNLGVLAGLAGQLVAGLPYLKAALEADPAQGQYWLSYADALLATGQAAEALNVIQTAIQRGLNTPAIQALRQKAEIAALNNNTNDTSPTHAEINQLVALFNAGRYREMENQGWSLLERYPDSGLAWKLLGAALKVQGKEAISALQKATQLLPGDAEAHYNLGLALKDLGQLGAAVASYRRALEIRPDYVEAHNNLGNALKDLGQISDAVACYRRALEIKPNSAETHNNLGSAMKALGQPDNAVASYRRALALKPDYAEAHNNLGNVLESLGQLDDALASYRRALEIKPQLAMAHNNLGHALRDLGLLDEAEACYRRVLEIKSDYIPDVATPPITALFPFGRSGSLFFHSLFDGHPEIATLPGCYFQGWFGLDQWKRFAPNTANPNWRKHLVAAICEAYQPLFDPRCRQSVPGHSFNSDWLARDLGFMDMGADRSGCLVADQDAFAAVLLSLLAPLSAIGQKECFQLIHRAFEMALRGNTALGAREDGHIFFHIHSPDPYELAHFLQHYPEANLLHILRNPVQSMEAWMTNNAVGGAFSGKDMEIGNGITTGDMIDCWNMMISKVSTMFRKLQSPYNRLAGSRGVRLEDVKRDAHKVMPRIAAWMGVSDHPALYESSFLGMQYWGPSSKATGAITGFDTRSIDRQVGRLLGARDIIIFETLFWPLSHLYGYTDLDAGDFRRQLAQIRPWLDEPLEFEIRLYAELRDHSRELKALRPYHRLHGLLHELWALLDRDGTYPGVIQPLELD